MIPETKKNFAVLPDHDRFIMGSGYQKFHFGFYIRIAPTGSEFSLFKVTKVDQFDSACKDYVSIVYSQAEDSLILWTTDASCNVKAEVLKTEFRKKINELESGEPNNSSDPKGYGAG